MKENKDLVEVPEIDGFTVFMKRVIDYIGENRKTVIIGIAAFFIFLLLISSIPSFINAKREKSFAELQKALRVIESEENLDLNQIEKAFLVLNEKYKGTKASALGDIYLGRAIYGLGENEKAAVYFKKAANYFGKLSLPGRLSMYELGALYLDDFPEKAEVFLRPLSESESFIKEDALFYLAVSGDPRSIERLKKEYPDGFYSGIIKEKNNFIKSSADKD
ncbi:MAG: hypothetical protein RBR53_04800 [Desulforegulaceae bacterium]|nr:hypothetical protein [Desulforegulaceae bacterium]